MPPFSGVVEDLHPVHHYCPSLASVRHFLTVLVPPVLYLSLLFVYLQDIPRCRSWRNPRHASPWTRAALSRSSQCDGRQDGAWASNLGSGCCSRRTTGCCPARAPVGSRGPLVHCTGSIGDCCWRGQAHGGTAGLQMQLGAGKVQTKLVSILLAFMRFKEPFKTQQRIKWLKRNKNTHKEIATV